MKGMEVTNCEWAKVDGWWKSHIDPDQSILTDADSIVLDAGWFDGQWTSIDDWWTSYVSTDRLALVDDLEITPDDRSQNNSWDDLDDWWQTYSEARQKDVKELLATLDLANETWAAGPSQFDSDPLSADWQTAKGSTGPIQLSREEDWSYGLAELFRSGSGVLIDELIDIAHEGTPESVETEAHLPGGSETTRYEDILINYLDGGISIEVKIGDTNLQKTVETAALVERHYSGDWTHILLLPAYQHPQLRDTFGEELTEPAAGPPIIAATPFGNREIEVQVRNWQEISTALRAILQHNDKLPPHWVASAYVVCTLIEQRILGFAPKPMLKRMLATDDIIHNDVSLATSFGDIDSEISYLQATTKETQYE